MGFNYKSNLNGFTMILKKKINSVKELKYKKIPRFYVMKIKKKKIH